MILKRTGKILHGIGAYCLFMVKVVSATRESLRNTEIIFRQMVRLGVNSTPVVMLASVFAGTVLTLQTGYQLANTFLPADTLGAVVVPTLILEMAALTPGLVLASRIGASIAAELGTMKVTEQVDALEAMGLNSVAYLVIPRIAAGAVMFPCMYVASALLSVWAGAFSADFMGFSSMDTFLLGARTWFNPADAYYGLAKSAAFGFVITSISCWKGLHTRGGADGVGRAATEAVVLSCLNILIADFVLAEVLL
ncbi:MAG: ABC transporter permease [Bacteroidetes bacterium]|nr:ABC transporter permease [Bacteroidota bacterium]